MVDDVRQTPFKRAHQTIVVALVIPAFPPVHVVLPERHKLGILRQIGGKSKRPRILRIYADGKHDPHLSVKSVAVVDWASYTSIT